MCGGKTKPKEDESDLDIRRVKDLSLLSLFPRVTQVEKITLLFRERKATESFSRRLDFSVTEQRSLEKT